MSFKLLVFDWDGTLMDSEARIVGCIQVAIEALGSEPRSDDQIRNIIGLGLQEAVLTLYPGANQAFMKAISDEYRRHFLELSTIPSALFDQAANVLSNLHAGGYWLAVATGKARHGLDRVLTDTGLADIFQASRCADETRSKPHPQMLEEILAELGVSVKQALMIGDTEYDMQMSRQAGTQALAVSYGVHQLERLMAHGPVGYIDAIADLPAWLNEYDRNIPVADRFPW